MGKTSDTKGKAFEYSLSDSLQKQLKLYGYTVILTQRFIECQNADSIKFASLETRDKEYFTSQSKVTTEWFIKLFSLNKEKQITLNRLTDSKGTVGNPTDIEVISSLKQINISAKHNNFSMKHQRLPSLYQQLGISKSDLKDKNYRQELKCISNNFYSFAQSIDNTFTMFSEIKNLVPESINEKLYAPSLDLYCKSLMNYKNSVYQVQSYFNFLLGKIDFFHVKMDAKKVVIKDYSSINPPTSFELLKVNHSNQTIIFDNGFSFNFRLHTASSRLEKCGKSCCELKIDTTIISEPSISEYQI